MATEPAKTIQLDNHRIAYALNKLRLTLNHAHVVFLGVSEIRVEGVVKRVQISSLSHSQRATSSQNDVSTLFSYTRVETDGSIQVDHRMERYLKAIKRMDVLESPTATSVIAAYVSVAKRMRDLVALLDGLPFERFTQVGFLALDAHRLPSGERNDGR